MTYKVLVNRKPSLVAECDSLPRAIEHAATHADAGEILILEEETGRAWLLQELHRVAAFAQSGADKLLRWQ